jgi:hypothetical protein
VCVSERERERKKKRGFLSAFAPPAESSSRGYMPAVAAMEISNSNGEESKEGVLYDAQRLYDLGCGALRIDAYDEAADCLSKALEIRLVTVDDTFMLGL